MRKVLLKKPVGMKKSPPFKGGKKNLMQKKMDAHLDKHPAPESFSLKKLRKEAYNWRGRVEFYLNEGDPLEREKREKKLKQANKKNKWNHPFMNNPKAISAMEKNNPKNKRGWNEDHLDEGDPLEREKREKKLKLKAKKDKKKFLPIEKMKNGLKESKEDNKGFKGTHKKGANFQVLKRGKKGGMADKMLKAHLDDRAALRKPGIGEPESMKKLRKGMR